MSITPEGPFFDEREQEAARKAVADGTMGGGGPQLDAVETRLRARLGARHALAVSSCTHALEMALMVRDIGPGDEVIVPAFTFPSTATCVLREGARVVFADVRDSDLNIDPEDVRGKITPRTRAIVAVHYAGMPCDMDTLAEIAGPREILLVEDAAHAFDSRLAGRACGTIGDVGCLSFQSTKNLTCGEGGAFLTNDEETGKRAELLREMGTDRAAFRRKEVARYTWRDVGSSFIPSEILMAVLAVQIEKADHILERRRSIAERYREAFADLVAAGRLRLQEQAAGAESNAHIFYALLPSSEARRQCEAEMRQRGVPVSRHYDSLDATPMGQRILADGGQACERARSASERLLRLPLHPRMTESDVERVISGLREALAATAPRP